MSHSSEGQNGVTSGFELRFAELKVYKSDFCSVCVILYVYSASVEAKERIGTNVSCLIGLDVQLKSPLSCASERWS